MVYTYSTKNIKRKAKLINIADHNSVMIAVVILNYNSFSDTIKLVGELQRQTVANDLRIVVVDNASPNDSYLQLKPLEKRYPNVTVLQTGSNIGYARGNNFGLQYLDKNIHPQYVAIMNNDVILQIDCLEILIERYNRLERPAIIAPKQLDGNSNEMPPYRMNSFLDDCLNLFYIFKIFHRQNALRYVDNTGLKAMRVEMIPGSFMFTSFNRFKEMGFFYPNTFLFVEERFIAVKAKQMNLNNYILLDKTYVHAHSKTINTQYNQTEKFRLLYDGWLEFTRACRSHSNMKVVILRFLMKLSLFEIQLANTIRNFIAKNNS